MPISKGKIGSSTVTVLRDTGCSGVVVKKKFVKDCQYTGRDGFMTMVDRTTRKAPIARIYVDTPYFTGDVDALCLPDAIYDLFIGNIDGARHPNNPKQEWEIETSAAKSCDKKQLSLTCLSMESFHKFQENDKSLKLLQNTKNFVMKDNILYRKRNDSDKNNQLVVPARLRLEIIAMAHDIPMSGHLGFKKTYDRISAHYFWPGMTRDVREYCLTCDICQKTVQKGTIPVAPLGTMPIIETPFERVAIDLVGPIVPASSDGHKYILTCVDFATRYPEAVALDNIRTETVAEALVTIFCRMGIPSEILSDQGAQFTSDMMREIGKLLSIKQLITTPYHPMCNGMCESFNKCLKMMLKRMCADEPKEWHKYIDALLFSYREVPHSSTGFSPFELIYGRPTRGPLSFLKDIWTGKIEKSDSTPYEYVFNLRERFETTMEIVKRNSASAQAKSKIYYDQKSKERNIKVGDEVLLLIPTSKNKLKLQWKGPYTVENQPHKYNYRIKINGKLRTYHVNMLRKYFRRDQTALMDSNNDVACTSVLDENDLEGLDFQTYDICRDETISASQYGKDLTTNNIQDLEAIVSKYNEVFSNDPRNANLPKHKIHLTSNTPVVTKPYPLPFKNREKLKKEIKKMEETGIIRRSDSPYASPVVVVSKKDGSDRICVDYRKLNHITIFDPEPMISVNDLLHKLNGSKYITKLDLCSGYWQIQMDEQDVHKTAFVTPDGHFEFLKMPFGLVNSGATLVRNMRTILGDVENVESYVDDIIIYNQSWDVHLHTLNTVLKLLKTANICIKPTKCIFGTSSLEFLGHEINNGWTSLSDDNTAKIANASRPTTKKQVQAFLGLTGYYREYIKDYSSIAASLTDLTRKGVSNKVPWNEQNETAFDSLKKSLLSKPVLKLPDLNRQFILRTDASDVGLGAVLLQDYEGKLLPVSYSSRKLLDREKNYSISEKECLAIVWAVEKYMKYLFGTEFIVQTDHEALKYMESKKFTNARLMRWSLSLQPYKMKIQHIKGIKNIGADYLSRMD